MTLGDQTNDNLINSNDLEDFLNEKAELYEVPGFIENDPILIPHLFQKKEDIEIAGFLTSVIAWGLRKTIIKNSNQLIQWMDNAPHDFIVNHKAEDLKKFQKFVHRTFNSDDLLYFIYRLNIIYKQEGGLENVFNQQLIESNGDMKSAIAGFKSSFFSEEHLVRSQKHLPNPLSGSAAKRFNMFLRWMVRSEKKEVDFGLWKSIDTSQLYLPLDVHTGNVARKLGLLSRKQNDWKALEEVMKKLRKLDRNDPVKYDFALFGMGVSGDL
jgi:uncharacterized protein (TIGR02757 family)